MQGQQASPVHKKLPRTEIPLQQTSSSPSKHPFRVCTFNLLADGLAQSGDFVEVPISCLQWEHRLPLILQEVREADADIICLQELNHFDVLAAALVPEGYSCFFRAKKPSPATKFGFPADGIALFYRHSRFSCSPAPEAHCFESIDGHPAAQGFVTALLFDKQAQKHVLVAVTHLKAKAGADNEQTRVHQVRQLLQEVEHMQERHLQRQQQQQPPPQAAADSSSNDASSRAVEPAAVLICGDFNTTPDSDTVRTLMNWDHPGLKSIWDVAWAPSTAAGSYGSNGCSNDKHPSNGSGSLHAVQPTASSSGSNGGSNGKSSGSVEAGAAAAAAARGGGSSSSNGHQQSADAGQAAAASAPLAAAQEGCEFTTWKFRSNGVAKRTIDYVMYSQAQLTPVSRWRMLSEVEIGPAGLPSTVYPSDHMAVTCQFAWVEPA